MPSRHARLLLITLLTALMFPVIGAELADENQVVIRGLELAVDDLKAAEHFYIEGLAFEIARRHPQGEWSLLRNQSALLVLRHVPRPPEGSPQPYLNLRVADLARAVRGAQEAGARVADPSPQPNAIGSGVLITDPSGNPINLMRIDGDSIAADSPPLLFNIGIRVSDMQASESFLAALGLKVMTRSYLPKTLVWERNGGVSIVVHRYPDQPEAGSSRGVLWATAPNPREHLDRLSESGWDAQAAAEAGPLPAGWMLQAPSGTRIRLTAP
ncbi:MAG TPA: VOC family protein [Acidobacteriota bacterium]|nr:VOC family protein [Acidobacteriota bacterium]